MFTADTIVDVVLREMENDQEVRRVRSRMYGFDVEQPSHRSADSSPIISVANLAYRWIGGLFAPPCAKESTCA